VVFEVSLADRNKTLELLGRHLGLFEQRLAVRVEEQPSLFPEMTDEELAARLLAKRAARARDVTERPAAVERQGVAEAVPMLFGRRR
jgi:hypothetical protein